MNTISRICIVTLLTMLCQTGALAGSQSGGEIHFAPDQIVKLAKKIERQIANRSAQVAIISRVGRAPNKLPDGMEFTHVAFAVYSKITTTDGRILPGYAMYNLYQDDDKPNTSALFQDYPLDYYASTYALKAGVIIQTAIPHLSPHAFRHTFGWRWLQGGGDIYTLSKVLGHATVAVTERHYAHLLKGDIMAKADKIDLGLGLPIPGQSAKVLAWKA